MTYVLDTNVLLRLASPTSPQHGVVTSALKILTNQGHNFAIFPQAIYEFWSVATRASSANGLGYSIQDLNQWLAAFKNQFILLPDSAATFAEWERLVTQYGPVGKPSHDTRYVAAMLVHGIDHLLTFNGRDFARYAPVEGIVVIDPSSIVSSSQK